MGSPNWVELAEIVAARIANRKDVEWKLAVEHYGAIALSVYASATFLTPFLKTAPNWFYRLGAILLVVSFLTSLLWIFLTESAHAIDALLYRAYMDLANRLVRTDSITELRRLQSSWESTTNNTTSTRPCEWIAEKWSNFGPEQVAWFIVHVLISVIVHVGVWMMIYSLTLSPPSSLPSTFPFAPEAVSKGSA